MSGILIAGLLLVAALVIWVALESLGAHKKSEAIESQMSELRHDLQSVANAQAQATGQLTALAFRVNGPAGQVSGPAGQVSGPAGP